VAGFKIDGLPEDSVGRAFGIDGLQALLLAAQALRIRMEALGVEFSWLGGEPGASGIPPAIPTAFGLAFTHRAEELISTDLVKYAKSPEGLAVRRAEKRRVARRAGRRR
jgi:hypothetical protein